MKSTMKPTAVTATYGVKALCPDCGIVAHFDFRSSSGEYGTVIIDGMHNFNGGQWSRVIYKLLRCSSCGRGGLAKFHDAGHPSGAVLEAFTPRALERAHVPNTVPTGIQREFREAELCASAEAWRGASALLRSVLEKTLKANGYTKGSLEDKIDDAAADGVITEARKRKAHEDIRSLGNEVLHDEWHEVKEEEVEVALHYAQRILEDLYDDRIEVEKQLVAKGRIAPPSPPSP